MDENWWSLSHAEEKSYLIFSAISILQKRIFKIWVADGYLEFV